MPIVGLTVSEQGESIQRLAVTTKVAIGEVVKTGSGATRPAKLDHFIFLRKSGTTFEWEPDPDLSKHYGPDCRDIRVVLLDDEVENVFPTKLAWWSKTECKCWGDGRSATRRTPEHPDGEAWTPCGDECPEMQTRKCKPSGDLRFMLADFPRLGAVCKLHTTSYRSIRQIYSALEQIRAILGGRLNGICCKLVVRPERAAYMDGTQKKTTTVYALNIELEAQGVRKLLGKATEYAQLFTQTQRLLAGRKVEFDEEPENVIAGEIVEEFPPEPEKKPVQQPSRRSAAPATTEAAATEAPAPPAAAPPAAATPAAQANKPATNGGKDKPVITITDVQRKAFYDLCVQVGWNSGEVSKTLKTQFGLENSRQIPTARYDEVCNFFKNGPAPNLYQASDEDLPENMR